MTTKPDKTFGLKSATDLYLKLLFDIERLGMAWGSTKAVQYAAFDCAVTSSHILDWVLHELDEAHHLRLTGVKKADRKAIAGFIDMNRSRMPGLEYCRQIANSVKHVVISFGPVEKDMSTGASVRFHRDGGKITHAYAQAYIKLLDKKHPVIYVFELMGQHWKSFLDDEGLWVEQPPGPDEQAAHKGNRGKT
ncbi:hypothetical protein [Rhizobium ruizarguesonis]|uniref:hypothetical protein n=1 Tax=Rhizobium ruizarguesonis TaxID=2081791 RepID=UPI00102F9DDA|nr:hypothetical protein [Rhizobium ruizarguesonis]TAV04550.1 hypothetical protein ELI39_04210 [Rhizobium ruizarguesonis]